MDFLGKKVAVVGLGMSGCSSIRLLQKKGAIVYGFDDRLPELQKETPIQQLQSSGLILIQTGDSLPSIDIMIVSPGIPETHPLYLKAKKEQILLMGEVDLACRYLTQQMIGITGTNGKTTVTLLVEYLLNSCGIPARAFGNVGVPLTALACEEPRDEVIVVELSSYQLETLNQHVLDAGVILNITPDHLDRYASMDEYAAAKFAIVNCLKRSAPLWIWDEEIDKYKKFLKNAHWKSFGSNGSSIYSNGESLFYDEKIEHILPLRYRGRITHDVTNFLAAYALCRQFGAKPSDLIRAAEGFQKPPHRIEFVREHEGVSYFDDSKGTNIDAVIHAVASMQGNVVLIAGGVHKGYPYTEWKNAFSDKVKAICAIGQAAKKIYEDLSFAYPVRICQTLEDAVKMASQVAQRGDSVLLSPGCSSFDMFKDYAHRGKEFQRFVHQL